MIVKILLLLTLVGLITSLELAQPCDENTCKPPSCRCSLQYLGNKTDTKTLPQLVMLTFDDAITIEIYNMIVPMIEDRVNPDGCPSAYTYFASHEYTDYPRAHLLWADGHEIAMHSVSHQSSVTYWREATVPLLINEFGTQRKIMSHFGKIDIKDIKGIRVPLFELSYNNSFEMMQKEGFLWDASWPTQHFINPGLWPYSLKYKSTQDCPLDRCPTASIPEAWVLPILDWTDLRGTKCAMVDACTDIPEDLNGLVEWMKSNFLRSYNGNRAPFGVYLHAAWFLQNKIHLQAYSKFLEYMNSLPDVYFVSSSRALEYVRNPKPIGPGNYKILDKCQETYVPSCIPLVCKLIRMDTNEERYMNTCQPECPSVYPWLSNPYGNKTL